MFRSSTIIGELALDLVKVIFLLKHSVKLRRYLLCGCAAACSHTRKVRGSERFTAVGTLRRRELGTLGSRRSQKERKTRSLR